eukprot:scaffold109030_cov32-Attheya_sp.AAC.1
MRRITTFVWTVLEDVGTYADVVVVDVRCKNRVDVVVGDDTIENALATPMMRDVTKRVDMMTMMLATFLEGPLPAADDRSKKGVPVVVMGSSLLFRPSLDGLCDGGGGRGVI